VFVGRRQASVSGSDISAEARAKLVERVVAMARLAPEDPYRASPTRAPGARPLPRPRPLRSRPSRAEALEEARRPRRGRRRAQGDNSDGASASGRLSMAL
jgi:PmbA protein